MLPDLPKNTLSNGPPFTNKEVSSSVNIYFCRMLAVSKKPHWPRNIIVNSLRLDKYSEFISQESHKRLFSVLRWGLVPDLLWGNCNSWSKTQNWTYVTRLSSTAPLAVPMPLKSQRCEVWAVWWSRGGKEPSVLNSDDLEMRPAWSDSPAVAWLT